MIVGSFAINVGLTAFLFSMIASPYRPLFASRSCFVCKPLQLGDVTIVLSKKRRNFGPRRVKIIVTNLLDASASAILNQYAIRWAVELTIKELKSGLHLGRMQVSQDAERVERSVVLPVCAYLLLVHLHGRDQAEGKGWSLFQLKQGFAEALMQDQVNRVEQKWRRKWCEINDAA